VVDCDRECDFDCNCVVVDFESIMVVGCFELYTDCI